MTNKGKNLPDMVDQSIHDLTVNEPQYCFSARFQADLDYKIHQMQNIIQINFLITTMTVGNGNPT